MSAKTQRPTLPNGLLHGTNLGATLHRTRTNLAPYYQKMAVLRCEQSCAEKSAELAALLDMIQIGIIPPHRVRAREA